MWMYLAVFLCAFAVDLIPVIAPPAWTLMVFFLVKFHLNPWVVLVAGVSGSTLGKYIFSLYVPKITNQLIKRHKREELEFMGKKLDKLEQVEQVTEQVPADDFQALEDKIYRTIEMYKAARQAQAAAERDAQRVRQQMQDREEELVTLRRETVRLKKEREEIRGRVEKMLQQIESIAEAS